MFCVDNFNIGGTELNAVRTAERLDRSHFELSVVGLQSEGPLLERYREAGIPVHSFPLSSLYDGNALRQGMRLRRHLQRSGAEILHAHDIYSNLFGVFWGRMAGVRTIASRRWWEGLPSLPWRVASRAAHHLADVTLVNSERIGRYVHQCERLSSERIVVVRNFVDDDAFLAPSAEFRAHWYERWGVQPGDRTVGIIANLHPIKDHASLVRAVRLLRDRVPELRLIVIGDGPERAGLAACAEELGIADRIVFAGRLPNRVNLHHLFEISVLCSRSEGLPNSVLEAMAAGRPVVATEVGATADAVVDGTTGLLVPASDPAALAAALGRLLDDRALAYRCGAAGRVRASDRYSASGALQALESLYRSLAAPRPAPAPMQRAFPLRLEAS